MKKLNLVVVYNKVTSLSFGRPEDIIADADTIIMAKKVADALSKRGHQVNLFELDEASTSKLANIKTDCFFNLCGGVDSIPHSESLAAAKLEETGRPVAGSGPRSIELTTDKIATKKVFQKGGVPTPKFLVAENDKVKLSALKFPILLKPSIEDCSLGISQDSVFKSEEGVQEKIVSLINLYHEPVLIEEYIAGRELRVSIVGNGDQKTALPISELVFGKSFKDQFKIFDFSAKWLEGSQPYEDTYAVSPAKLSPPSRSVVEETALLAYDLTGCSDYGRIDIRLDKDDVPHVLEVNANPAIGPNDALATSAEAAGISYGELLEMIVESAIVQGKSIHEAASLVAEEPTALFKSS